MPTLNPLQQACADKGVAIADVEAVLKLYNSDEDDDVVLEKIAAYPKAAKAVASALVLGTPL